MKLSKAQTRILDMIKKAVTYTTVTEAVQSSSWDEAKYIKELDAVVISRAYLGTANSKTLEVLVRLGLIECKNVDLEMDYVHPKTGAVSDFSTIYREGFDMRNVKCTNHRYVETKGLLRYGSYQIKLKA